MSKTSSPLLLPLLFLTITSLVGCDDAEAPPTSDASSAQSGANGSGNDQETLGGSSGSAAVSPDEEKDCIHAGNCTAKKIADGLVHVSEISATATARWVSSDEGITRIDDTGPHTFSNVLGTVRGIAAVGDVVAWNTSDTLYSMAPGKQPTTRISAESTLEAPRSIIASGSRVWFLQGHIAGWIDIATAQTAQFVLNGYEKGLNRDPNALTVEQGQVFWTDRDVYGNAPVRIRTVAPDGTKTLAEIEGADMVFAMVATKSHVIVSDHSQSRIVACPRQGGTLTVIAEKETDVESMAHDDTGVYWVNGSGVMRADTDGSNVRLLLKHGFTSINPGSIAVDPTSIYFTDPGAGAVFEIKK